MRPALALALAGLAIAAPARADDLSPGAGTRILGELGGGLYNATFATSRGADSGRVGIDGVALRVRGMAGFPVARGLFLGPSLGLDVSFVDSTRDVCCGGYDLIHSERLGLEAAYYLDRSVGFRIHAGFGLARATLGATGDSGGALGAAAVLGPYWTAAIARDYAIGARTRLGGVLRIESDVLGGRDGDHVYTLRTLTPSLSVVVLSQWPG
jgi:hypothetical protein